MRTTSTSSFIYVFEADEFVRRNLDYISSRRAGSVYVRKHFGVSADQHPEELTSKVYLLKHFEAYMMERLYGNHSFCWDDTDRMEGMDFVQKYFRMKNVIVFKLSNEAIQVGLRSLEQVLLLLTTIMDCSSTSTTTRK